MHALQTFIKDLVQLYKANAVSRFNETPTVHGLAAIAV